jgi:hypothetical protein
MGDLGDILTALDVYGVKERPAELGSFNVESLSVQYDFTREELADALRALSPAADPLDPVKTVMHETTHLFHLLTTPFGFLVYALRRMQAMLVRDMITELRFAHGLKIRYPLVQWARELPEEASEAIYPNLFLWYESELFILFALDGIKSWEQQIVRNPLLRSISPSVLFADIQYAIAAFYRLHARQAAIASGISFEEAALPFADYVADELPADAMSDAFLMLVQTLHDDLNMIFITESAGTIAESWGSQSTDGTEVWRRFQATFNKRGLGNMVGTKILDGPLNASNTSEFVQSYLALCDLSLFGPVLPQYRALRHGPVDLWELVPFLRWWRLVTLAREVEPMHSLDDYGRYTDELCERLGWVSPRTITQTTAAQHIGVPEDFQEATFVAATQWRASAPGIFQNYGWVLQGDDAAHAAFQSEFHFPVIQYRDRTVYLKDTERLLSLTREYLVRAALRAAFLRDKMAVRMPYRPKDPKEVAFLRETLVGDLAEIIGIRIGDLELTC